MRLQHCARILWCGVCFWASCTMAGPMVANVTARQRYPWNGKVDIAFTLTEDVSPEDFLIQGQAVSLKVAATDQETGMRHVASALDGDLGLAAGTHGLVWDMSADGLAFASSNVVFSVSCETNAANYCVIDLSAGAAAPAYPVAYLADPPAGGFNADDYKTTKLVLRRLEPGTFRMCDEYETTLTKSFYIGIFEMTQRQYALVMGGNPSFGQGDMRPVENLTYNAIRGSAAGAHWPASAEVDPTNFLGVLRARTGIKFDLPTEAQWEYACRAGTTNAFNNGGASEDDLKLLGRYAGNTADGKGGYSTHTAVGSYQPNAWGLYDMHGNVFEWCLDWYDRNGSGSGGLTSPQTDPAGVSSGESRVRRGGSWGYDAYCCRSDWRFAAYPSWSNDQCGFRLAVTLPSAYALVFDPNGGSGTMPGHVFRSGGDLALPLCTYTNGDKTFVGWSESADGPVAYADGAAIPGGFAASNGATVTLYARWSSGTYAVAFDSNGGEGTMADQVMWAGIPASLSSNAFTRTGHLFAGWATEATGAVAYADQENVGDLATPGATVTLYAVWESASPLYCVIDLSAGASASSYPVTYLAAPPEGGFNADAYKTTKLVLRRIDPGTFMMCGEYETTLTQPYYIGIFEMTQKQCGLIMGGNPSFRTGDMRPVEMATYNAIRGTSAGSRWPVSAEVDPSSLIGVLRSRTGIGFDLPTEAQWEYACRAGTASDFNNGGNSEDDLKQLGRYSGNCSDGKGGYPEHTTVGSYRPNAWGLYDMHGNVYEWCLDWWGDLAGPQTNFLGGSSGSRRVLRGGSWTHPAGSCSSARRTEFLPAKSDDCFGLRLAAFPLPSYAIVFVANGGSGTMPDAIVPSGSDITLPSCAFTNGGKRFVGWSTSADGPIVYADGAAIPCGLLPVTGEAITLYARWSAGTCTIVFDANGGSGTMADQTLWADIPAPLARKTFWRSGFMFDGWATEPDGDVVYSDGETVTCLAEPGATVTLYAVWKQW